MPYESARWWSLIRASRARLPGLAFTDLARRDVYVAALQQFEELWRAAEVAGAASRPLPLFYGLSQAGRAIAAAHRDEAGWDHHGHGLTISNPREGLHATVDPTSRRQSFQVVAETVASPPLARPAKIGALLLSLPEAATFPIPEERWLPAIRTTASPVFQGLSLTSRAHHRGDLHVAAAVPLRPVRESTTTPAAWLGDVLPRYPTAAGWSEAGQVLTNLPPDSNDLSTLVTLRREMSEDDWQTIDAWLDQLAPINAADRSRWVRPSVTVEADAPPSLLMTWWALLFGLSILARYEPATWGEMIDVDRQEWAVTIEATLRAAAEAIPVLVTRALYYGPESPT